MMQDVLETKPSTKIRVFVNPIVAIGLRHFLAGELITPRTVAATILVTGSVFLILSKTRR